MEGACRFLCYRHPSPSIQLPRDMPSTTQACARSTALHLPTLSLWITLLSVEGLPVRIIMPVYQFSYSDLSRKKNITTTIGSSLLNGVGKRSVARESAWCGSLCGRARRRGTPQGQWSSARSRGEFSWWSTPSQKELSYGIHQAESSLLCAHQKGNGNPAGSPMKTCSHPGLRWQRVLEPFTGNRWWEREQLRAL